MRRTITLLALCSLLGAADAAVDPELVDQTTAAVKQTVTYLREQVAYGGGYVGWYLPDLSDQWGETHCTRTESWVQPPGSPSTGFAFLRLWEATGDPGYLAAAKENAESLVFGQLACGGWLYVFDHDPANAARYAYRRNRESADEKLRKGRNQATLDDNTTQHCTRLLMAVDEALEFKDAPIHEAALAALDYLLEAQHEGGGWPQRWPASGHGYGDFFTFNDNTMRDCIDVMMRAYRIYGDERYADSAKLCGSFILNTQLPEPQPVWAQQYDLDLKPAWARRFEPPAACAGETSGVLSMLCTLAVFTGDEKYLEPIPRALAWYQRSELPQGGWARFYELKTNRPLYLTSDNRTTYWLTYSDSDLPDHYAFQKMRYPTSAERTLERIRAEGLAAFKQRLETPRTQTDAERHAAAEQMESNVKELLAARTPEGVWLTTMKGYGPEARPMLALQTVQTNLRTLAQYLELAK